MAETETEIIYVDEVTADPEVKMPRKGRHRDGCPERRLERYKQTSPENQGSVTYTITHCLDCGELHYERKG